MPQDKPQADKFKEAVRELGCDEDEARWEERLRKVATAKPAPEKPE
ncbi:MAG TPA: hypothetical protein VF603_07410 [Allosphingosinicella sp.]|jgi:hypothetical protein